MEAIDQGLWNWFQAHRTPGIDSLAPVLAFLGSAELLLGVVSVIGLVLIFKRKFLSAAVLAVTFGIAWLMTATLPDLVGRERPEVRIRPLEEPAGPYSFPSTHALLATATYLAVALAAADLLPNRSRRIILGAAILLVLAISLSRLFVGLSYPSDVGGGLLAGLCLAILLRSLLVPARLPPSSGT